MKLSVLVYLTIVYKVQQFKNCIIICFKMVALKLRKFSEHFIEFPITDDYLCISWLSVLCIGIDLFNIAITEKSAT